MLKSNFNRHGSNLTFEAGLIVKKHVIKDIRSFRFFFFHGNQITLAGNYFFLIFHLIKALNVFVLNAVILSQNFFY